MEKDNINCAHVVDFLGALTEMYGDSNTLSSMVFEIDSDELRYNKLSYKYGDLYQDMMTISLYVCNMLHRGCLFELG